MNRFTLGGKTKTTVLLLLCLVVMGGAIAQPVNDDCTNATEIVVPNNGFGRGVFTSTVDDITQATIQAGETFAPAILVAGQNDKSMWYKFTIATTRAIRVTLAQPGTVVTAGDAGFAVYKANNCLPNNTNISSKLTPIGTFGNTYHPCVDSGVYYIQVSSNTRANGPLYIQVNISDTTGALYDRPQDAYDFGVVTPNNKRIDYLVSCQSIEDENEKCNVLAYASQYHKSTWHTFTTPVYFDYLTVMLAAPNGNYFVNANTLKKFGYTLYKGNAATAPLSSLVVVDGCDSLQTNGYRAAFRMYKCEDLEPNTTYSIQLFAHETFNADIRLGITVGGSAPTQAPQPILTNFPASNSFGNLVSTPSGSSIRTLTDNLGCNSRHSITACGPAIPAGGLRVGSINYNLSAFFTFSLTTTSSVEIYTDRSCGQYLYVQLYNQSLTASCNGLDTANLVASFTRTAEIDCLAPGDYVVQLMGTDTTVPANDIYYSTAGANNNQCISNNLGNAILLRLRPYSRQTTNNYSLSATGKFDTINKVTNAMAPLVHGVNYNLRRDTIGCENTVLPADTSCSPTYTKAIYRQFVVADSGAVGFWNTPSRFQYKLYRGDANALATAQSAFAYPDKITGLMPVSLCMDYYTTCSDYNNVCVTPGTYTYVSFTDDGQIGNTNAPTMGFDSTRTKFYSPSLAQDMGSILDSVSATGGSRKSAVDMFTCKDNAEVINGYQPCKINNVTATKAIYRQFYLKEDAMVSIAGNGGCGFYSAPKTLFNGKATDGLSTLTPVGAPWNCFTSVNSAGCRILPAGWYTVVSYGVGPTYDQPLKDLNLAGSYASNITKNEEFTITVTVCPSPKYNRPYKASVNASQQPHLVEWKHRVGSTPAYPRTDTIYTLPTENFNCIDDTPFVSHPVIACDTSMKKVAYWVFQTTQLSYVEISTGQYWGAVYALDVRTDSSQLLTANPIQPCVKGDTKIQLCRLLPGTYTLVVFAPTGTGCTSVTPFIYIDGIQGSRFDHAVNAYDFGIIPPDSVWHRGKPGEVNPLNPLRAASSDFFSCTTGSAPSDPTNSMCESDLVYNMYDPSINHMYEGTIPNGNHIIRRNLWYTFVIDKPGWFHIKIENKTPGKTAPGYRFAVYSSDVDGSLPFSDVITQGLIDSVTGTGGLVHLGHNGWPNYCNALKDGLSFYRDPCTQFEPQRYYIVVDNRNAYGYYDRALMYPNNQLEVAILLDSINLVPTKYDHYYKAYDFDSVGIGLHVGGVDNYTCATRNTLDPISGLSNCTKTLWYKFTATITGNVRFRIKADGIIKYGTNDIRLFQELIPGDSTSAGLAFRQGSSFRGSDGTWWSQHCVSPGTWYLLLPGCNQGNEYVFPEIELVEQEGDFCNRPMVVNMTGAGSATATTIIDCHTIGTDYGEFNPTVTCPVGAPTERYKSSWFRLDITGNDTLHVTTYISENTNVLPADIKYRMMTGDCNAMQEQSCVLDAQTQNTYKCLTAGSYYFQVFTPVTTTPTNNTRVTGDITLHLISVNSADTCAPINNCLANANFIPEFDCTTDTSVRFANFSTFGSSIQYQWDFGYAGAKSTATSPHFQYPELNTAQTYSVKLKVDNVACGGKDSVTIPITIPARPTFNLGPDTALCNGGNIMLDATSWPGSTYRWSTNATTSTINTSGSGVRTYWARVTYNGCIKTDTIRVYVNPITAKKENAFICADSVELKSGRNQSEQHMWNTGATTASLWVRDTGLYTNSINWYGCTINDTFSVYKVNYPFDHDTIPACFAQPYVLNATTYGATSYVWQNNSRQPTFSAASEGKYWVRITIGSCTISDTIVLTASTLLRDTIAGKICSGQGFTLPSGNVVDSAGIYIDTIKYAGGCDSLVTVADIAIETLTEDVTVVEICSGQLFNLPWGGTVNAAGLYSDVMQSVSGCDSMKNTIDLRVHDVVRMSTAAAICAGENYTLPSGAVVNQPGTYHDTTRNATGCDSLVAEVVLAVRSVQLVNEATVLCHGQQYTLPSGAMVSTAGIHYDTLLYQSGCDSLITVVDITLNSLTRNTVAASICEGENYTLPSGAMVNATGTYSDTLKYTSGCDSIIYQVDLAVRSFTRNTITTSICEGATYTLPSGTVVNAAGQYHDTLHYLAGCDSLITTIDLSVATVNRLNITPAICQGANYTLPGGSVVNSAGLYNDTIRYASGCDSLIAEIDLSVKPLITQTLADTICEGASYTLPSGTVVSTAGTHLDTVHYASGCDSLITTFNLIVKPIFKEIYTPAICEGYTYTLPSGLVVNVTGNYSDTIRYASGCDSLVSSVSLVVLPVARVAVAADICEGQSYTLPAGVVVNQPGTYVDTIVSNANCDSIITTTIAVKPVSRQANAATICTGQSYTLPSGRMVTTAGVYSDTLKYISGCDSLISTVTIQMKTLNRRNIQATICEGETYTLPSGNTITAQGIYNDTLSYVGGCDSLVTVVDLKVNVVTRQSNNVVLCAGRSHVLPSGLVVTTAGTYRDTLTYANGCDSLVSTVTVAVRATITGTATATICEGSGYALPSGMVVNQAGTYSDTLRYQSGCDSLVTAFTLHVTPVNRVAISASICSGASYVLPSGNTVNTPGIYSDTLKFTAGCDSLVTTVNLTVTQAAIEMRYPSLCAGETYLLPSGKVINTSGLYFDTLRSISGCDSLITRVRCTVNPLPQINITKTNDINCITGSAKITATGGRSYRWWPVHGLSDDESATVIASPDSSMMYKVEVTTNAGCKATDSVQVVVNKGNAEGGYLLPSAFTPNGDGLNDCFGVKTWGWVSSLQFTVFDRWGNPVFQTTDPSKCWDGTFNGQKLGTAAYVYSISAITICGPVVRKGTIVLIR